MINTYSSFIYGLTVDETNKYLDFKEGAGAEITAELTTGDFTITDLLQNIEDAMNEVGGLTYNVTINRSTFIVTIAVTTSTMNLLANSGTNAANSIFETIGFTLSDSGNVTTKSGATSIKSSYEPQYLLQDYVDQKDSRMMRDPSVNKSTSGLVQVQNFGIDRMFEMSIKFATNILQPASGPIINNSSGVEDLQAFMQYVTTKKQFEFVPNVNAQDTFYRVLLESTSDSSNGTGYKLQEQFLKGLVGYYETGILKLRIIED